MLDVSCLHEPSRRDYAEFCLGRGSTRDFLSENLPILQMCLESARRSGKALEAMNPSLELIAREESKPSCGDSTVYRAQMGQIAYLISVAVEGWMVAKDKFLETHDKMVLRERSASSST